MNDQEPEKTISHRIAEFADKWLSWLPVGCIVAGLPAVAAIIMIGGVGSLLLRGVSH
jgi:hypothetical protein